MSTSEWDGLLRDYAFADPIPITRPTLPPLESYANLLRTVWDSHWLTNNGELHQRLEGALGDYLQVEHTNLFCNGTIALLVALQTLDIQGGEVITSPFTFPATPHALNWNRITPVFCDIDPCTYNLDPNRLEEVITPQTKAILPVHVYGTPCDVDAIQAIAGLHGLPVIYDAAHAFGVKYRGRPLVDYGDLAVLSFHATKLFTTGEGGALISHSPETQQRIYYLKNFGIAGEESVLYPGINGKMNELQAALGLLTLELIDDEIEQRKERTLQYRGALQDLPGLVLLEDAAETVPNYAYFPILIEPATFGMTRDQLCEALRSINVYPRKYFYPLCSRYACYKALPSAAPKRLPVAERVAQQVLCLPLYGELAAETVDRICGAIRTLHDAA